MNLTLDLFKIYFKNEINFEEFVAKLGIKENHFIDCLQVEIEKTCKGRNADRLENLIYVLFLIEDKTIGDDISELERFVKILNELVVSDWHTQHENIVLLLQKISNVDSLDYLYNAIKLKPQYLSWDENYAFEVKCVRAIYQIGKENAIKYLEELSINENKVISEVAQRQIKKYFKG